MGAGDDFVTKIVVETDFAEVLRRELVRPAWKAERVSLGTATDPYQPCEGRYRITRAVLEVLRDRGNPVSVVTKSTLVLRDHDVLADLARRTDVTVHFTITTLDPATWRATEPGTPPPWQRLRVMQRLVDAGVPCGVFPVPILPGITNAEVSIEAVIRAAREHGASHVRASALRLAPLVKEHYLGFVGETYPDLLPPYERGYTGANAPKEYLRGPEARVARIRSRCGLDGDGVRGPDSPGRPVPGGMPAPRGQLALPL